MKIRECNLCNETIRNPGCGESPCYGVAFGSNNEYDLCDVCIKLVRQAVCRRYSGTGRVEISDEASTSDQATCGESRTQYKTVVCLECK